MIGNRIEDVNMMSTVTKSIMQKRINQNIERNTLVSNWIIRHRFSLQNKHAFENISSGL